LIEAMAERAIERLQSIANHLINFWQLRKYGSVSFFSKPLSGLDSRQLMCL
jgi:hypothetical protein